MITNISGQFRTAEMMLAWIRFRYASDYINNFNPYMLTTICSFCFQFCVFYIKKTGYEKMIIFLLYDIRPDYTSSLNVSWTKSLSLLLNDYTLAFPDILDSQSHFSVISIQFSSCNLANPLSYQINSYSAIIWDEWVNWLFWNMINYNSIGQSHIYFRGY